MGFFSIFLLVPTILAVVGIVGGILFLVAFRKNKKKVFLVFGILAFVIASVCVMYMVGFILIYIVGGSLF